MINNIYDSTNPSNKLLGFLDGHESLSFAKTKLSALIHADNNLSKIYKYKFDLSKIDLISHWFPSHVIPSDRAFFNIKIYKASDLWGADLTTQSAGTRYAAGDDIPTGRKIGDIKDTVTPEYSTKITKLSGRNTSPSELDMTNFPVVVFDPPRNGIYTFVFEELSAKWFQDKIQELKDLSKKYAVGFKFPEFSRALTLTNNSPTAHTITFLTEDPNAGGDYILIPEEYRSLLVKDNFGKLFNITATFEGVPITVGLEPPSDPNDPDTPALDLDLVENDTPISTGNYTSTVAGTIKIQVEFFGAKQYRDRISGKVEAVVKNQLGATKDLLDTAVTKAETSETNAGASSAASITAQGLSEDARDDSVIAKGEAEGFKTAAETAAITAQNASLTSGYSDNKHLTTADLVVPPKAAAGEFEYVIPPTNRVHYFVDTSDVRQDRGGTGDLGWFIMDLPISAVAASIKAGETKSGVFEIMITKKNDGAIPIMIYPEGQNAKIEDVPRKSANFVAPYRIDKAGAYVFTLQRTVNEDDSWNVIQLSGHRDGDLTVTKAEDTYVPIKNIDVAGVTVGDAIPTAGVSVRNRPFRANKTTKVPSSYFVDKFKADKANTRKWLIIDALNAAGFSISDMSQTDYLYYITGGHILANATQASGYILSRGTQIGGDILDSGSQDGGRILQRGNQFGGQILYGGTKIGGHILNYGTQADGHILLGGTQLGGDILANGTQASGYILESGTQLGGDILASGTQFGGTILYRGTQFSGDILYRGTQFGGTILYRGTQIGRSILNRGKAIGTRLGMKVYGGDWSRTSLNNCIFTKDFSCPATIPADLSSVTGYDASAGSDENGTVAEKINWLQGKANQSRWTGIKIFGCFYEDGAILSGIPAETRAKIRPISEMGLPPAPIYKSNTRTFTEDVTKPAVSNDGNDHTVPFAPLSFYNLKKGRYKIEALIMCYPGLNDDHFRMYFSTDSTLDENADTRVIFPEGKGKEIAVIFGDGVYTGATFSQDRNWDHTFSDSDATTLSASTMNTEIEVPTDGLNLLAAFRYSHAYGGELIIGDARNYFRLIKLPSYEPTTEWDAP